MSVNNCFGSGNRQFCLINIRGNSTARHHSRELPYFTFRFLSRTPERGVFSSLRRSMDKGKVKAIMTPLDEGAHVDESGPSKTRSQKFDTSEDKNLDTDQQGELQEDGEHVDHDAPIHQSDDPKEAMSPLSEPDDSVREMAILDNWEIDRVDEICQDETWLETVTRNVPFDSDTLKALETLSGITKGHVDKVRGELSSIYRRRRKGSMGKGFSVGKDWNEKQELFRTDVNKIIDLVNDKGMDTLKRSEGLEARPRKDAAVHTRVRRRRGRLTERLGDQAGASGQTGGSGDDDQEDHDAEDALREGLSQMKNILPRNQNTSTTTTDPQASPTELGALMAPPSVQVPLDHASETERTELVDLSSRIQELTSEMDEAKQNIEGLISLRGRQNSYVEDGDPQVTAEEIEQMELVVLKKNQKLLELRGWADEIRRGLVAD